MTTNLDRAARAGGSAGAIGECEPADFATWSNDAQAAYLENYARGRFCRRVAEGKAKPLSIESPDATRYGGMTRAQLVAEFNSRADLQSEFASADLFVAFAMAASAGKARRNCGRVIKA